MPCFAAVLLFTADGAEMQSRTNGRVAT